MSLNSGLYMTATPIGNLADASKRAVEVLAGADLVLCEDTRHTGRLLAALGIRRGKGTLMVYNDQSGEADRKTILARLADGAAVACVSDAGTPLISDPGYKLVRAARAAGHAVYTIPGPSAVTAALSVAGQPTDRVLFCGFVPARAKAREAHFRALASHSVTSVHFETAQRLLKSLAAIRDVLGPGQPLSVCRELTKLHEETVAGTAADLLQDFSARAAVKGEIVLVLGPVPAPGHGEDGEDMDKALEKAIAEGRGEHVKALAGKLGERFALPRSEVYERILKARGKK